MADNGGGWNTSQTLEADQGLLLIDQDEGEGKRKGLNAFGGPLRMCSLSYPLKLHNRLHSRQGSSKLPRGSVWTDVANADEIVILSSSYSEMQGLLGLSFATSPQ